MHVRTGARRRATYRTAAGLSIVGLALGIASCSSTSVDRTTSNSLSEAASPDDVRVTAASRSSVTIDPAATAHAAFVDAAVGRKFSILDERGAATSAWFEVYPNHHFQGSDACGSFTGTVRLLAYGDSAFLVLDNERFATTCPLSTTPDGTATPLALARPGGPLTLVERRADGTVVVEVAVLGGLVIRAASDPDAPQAAVTSQASRDSSQSEAAPTTPDASPTSTRDVGPTASRPTVVIPTTRPADAPAPVYRSPVIAPAPAGSLRSLLSGRIFDVVSMNGIVGSPSNWFEIASDDSLTMHVDCGNDADGTIVYHGDGSIGAGAHLEIGSQTAVGCTTPTVYPAPRGELRVEGVTGDGRVLVSIGLDFEPDLRLFALSQS